MLTLAKSILKAKYFGTRDYKAHLSDYLKSRAPHIITLYGEPKKVVMEYDDMMELIDWYEELQDQALISDIAEARKSYERNPKKAVSAEKLFKSW